MTKTSALLLALLIASPAISSSPPAPIGQLIYLPVKPTAPTDFMAVPVAVMQNGQVLMQWMFVPVNAVATMPQLGGQAVNAVPAILSTAAVMPVAAVQTAASVPSAVVTSTAPAPKPAANLTHGKSMAATCYSCHGTDGKSHTAIPALAGMDKAYFVQQMQDFKNGKREATVMHQHAKGYTDEEFVQMAEVFAAIKP